MYSQASIRGNNLDFPVVLTVGNQEVAQICKHRMIAYTWMGAFGATKSWAIDWELNLRLELRATRPTTLIIAWISSLLQTFSSRTRNMTGARSQYINRYLSVYWTSTKFEGLSTNLIALMALPTLWHYVHTFKVALTFSKGSFIIALKVLKTTEENVLPL